MNHCIVIGERPAVIGSLPPLLFPPPIEFLIELPLVALFLFPLPPRATEGERIIVIHIAAVQVPERWSEFFSQRMTEGAILIDHCLLSRHDEWQSSALAFEDIGWFPTVEIWLRIVQPASFDLLQPRHFIGDRNISSLAHAHPTFRDQEAHKVIVHNHFMRAEACKAVRRGVLRQAGRGLAEEAPLQLA